MWTDVNGMAVNADFDGMSVGRGFAGFVPGAVGVII
jgi:hypothetical protein